MSDNEQRAFPTNTPFTNPEDRGMTLRDWFAGQWLSGTAADPEIGWSELNTLAVCRKAYEVADAMMEARQQKKDEVV